MRLRGGVRKGGVRGCLRFRELVSVFWLRRVKGLGSKEDKRSLEYVRIGFNTRACEGSVIISS